MQCFTLIGGDTIAGSAHLVSGNPKLIISEVRIVKLARRRNDCLISLSSNRGENLLYIGSHPGPLPLMKRQRLRIQPKTVQDRLYLQPLFRHIQSQYRNHGEQFTPKEVEAVIAGSIVSGLPGARIDFNLNFAAAVVQFDLPVPIIKLNISHRGVMSTFKRLENS